MPVKKKLVRKFMIKKEIPQNSVGIFRNFLFSFKWNYLIYFSELFGWKDCSVAKFMDLNFKT